MAVPRGPDRCSSGSGTRCTPNGCATPAKRPASPRVSALLYALSVVLLVIVAASFYAPLAGNGADPNAASALGLILFVSIIALLPGAPHYDLSWLIVAVLVVLAFVPIMLAAATHVWAATRPSVAGPAR